jgi:hypothetical protein
VVSDDEIVSNADRAYQYSDAAEYEGAAREATPGTSRVSSRANCDGDGPGLRSAP